MAGWWSRISDGSGSGSGSALECLKALQKFQTKSKGLDETANLRVLFNEVVSCFLKEICGRHYFRPFPPMLGNGQSVDLLKLYLFVREKGGYQSVSRKGLWELVAKESGFASSAAAGLKLVYVKYLDMLDSWSEKLVKDGLGLSLNVKMDDEKSVAMELEEEVDKFHASNEIQSCVESNGGKDYCPSDKDDNMGFESRAVKEDETSRKRKRECHLAMIDWVRKVAKDPRDPVIGSLPERFKWKAYGNEHVWKQVLLAREAMLLKRKADSSAVQSIWQIKQKMHPTMYDDHNGSERARCSQRLVSAKESRVVLSTRKLQTRSSSESLSTGSQSDMENQSNTAEDSLWIDNIRRKKIPLGQSFQAKVPEWTGETCESDKKWLGTRVWPLEKGEIKRILIERDRIGKGRQESCGCQFPGSPECFRFHIAEKRNKVRLELGSAFKQWKLNKIGEEVSLAWTAQEEKKFQDIVKSNPASSEKCFWDEITKYFQNRSREVLVSYYFNVYLLRRRAHQNRTNPNNIDSDDDELEKNGVEHEASKQPGSIFCSPKKVHLNVR